MVCVGHAFSHFYMLVLPPLFPFLRAEFDVSWAALGLLITAHSVATGIGQIPAGLIVDRFGARPVLFAGLIIQAGAFALAGFTGSFWALTVLVFIAGIGNAVFHPADMAILTARVGPERHGRAYGMHIFSGYAGWIVAPGSMLVLAEIWDWRVALLVGGIIGLLFVAVAAWQRDLLSDAGESPAAAERTRDVKDTSHSSLAVFTSLPVIMFFLFYTFLSMASFGVTSFSVIALVDLYGTTLVSANATLTVFFFAGGLSVLIGGWIADRTDRHEQLTTVSFILSAAMIAAIGFKIVPLAGVVVLMFMGSLFMTLVSPSRDIMVRNVAPPGTIGTVFGFVSTGFSVGAAVAPPIFGLIADIGRPELIFWLSGVFTLLCIVSVYGANAAKR